MDESKHELANVAIDIYETIQKFEKSNDYEIFCDLENNLIQVKLAPKVSKQSIQCNLTIYKNGECEIH